MGGYFPQPLGIAAFAGFKFAGYALAAVALKKIEPAILASALKIAGFRTGPGIVLGIPATLVGVFAMRFLHQEGSAFQLYLSLAPVRIAIWAILLFIFTKQAGITGQRLWLLAAAGSAWSCLLDWPALHLMLAAPRGQIPVC